MSKRLLFAACAWAIAGSASARAPVLVELFTAQGCASCGPADALIGKLADRADVIPLTWSVDYWDYLGWKDTFARPEFADRQRVFDHRFELRDVYTPQVIVGGAEQSSGDKVDVVDRMISEVRHLRSAEPQIRFLSGDRVAIGTGARPQGGGEVWLVRYDPRPQNIEVKDGDNRGKTVTLRNVVRELVRLGAWRGTTVTFKLPAASEEGLTSLVLVQGARGGRVLGLLKRDPA
jgi:hypothetical protein